MSKYFIETLKLCIIIFFVIVACCVFVHAKEFRSFSDTKPVKQPDPIQAKLKLDFQYSNMKAQTDVKNLYCSMAGKFRKNKKSPVELIFENELTYSKTDDDIDTDRQLLNYQINYFLPKAYVFLNMQSLKDSGMGIKNELSHGLGVGGQLGYIVAQIGIYSESENDSILSRGKVNCIFPLSNQIDLILNNTGEVNLSEKNKYRFESETAIGVSLADNLGLKIGYNIIYVEDDNKETLDTTKRYFTGLTYNF